MGSLLGGADGLAGVEALGVLAFAAAAQPGGDAVAQRADHASDLSVD